jgi:hypothetical protein
MQGTRSQTLLLRTILETSQPSARGAWEDWLDTVGDPVAYLRADTSGIRRLLPLLLVATRRNGLSVESTFLTVIRSAYVREELRERIYRRVLVQLLAGLHAAELETVLINGAALAYSVYPEPLLRHCHNIDLYCNVFDIERAVELLGAFGFRETARNRGSLAFEHRTGLPVELHQRLLGMDDTRQRFAAVYERSLQHEIDGRPVRILAPEDTLLQICAHDPGESGIPAPWLICDAWMQLERGELSEENNLRQTATSRGLDASLDGMLIYLARELGVPYAQRLIDPARDRPQGLQNLGIS